MAQYSSKEVEHIVTDAIARERERCAKVAEAMAIQGHAVQEPSCLEIAKRIREGPKTITLRVECSTCHADWTEGHRCTTAVAE